MFPFLYSPIIRVSVPLFSHNSCSHSSVPQVSILIRDHLIERAKDFSIILDDVSIVSFHGDLSSGGVVNLWCLCFSD